MAVIEREERLYLFNGLDEFVYRDRGH